MTPPRADEAFTVFVQRPDVRLDLASLERSATSFFGARVGLAAPKRYDEGVPAEDAASFVIARGDERGVIRWAFGRARSEEDLAAARAAELAMGGGGLGGLAARCPTVWLVAAPSEDDEAALCLAGVLANVGLGPILPPGRREIFGVRTVRMRLGV